MNSLLQNYFFIGGVLSIKIRWTCEFVQPNTVNTSTLTPPDASTAAVTVNIWLQKVTDLSVLQHRNMFVYELRATLLQTAAIQHQTHMLSWSWCNVMEWASPKVCFTLQCGERATLLTSKACQHTCSFQPTLDVRSQLTWCEKPTHLAWEASSLNGRIALDSKGVVMSSTHTTLRHQWINLWLSTPADTVKVALKRCLSHHITHKALMCAISACWFVCKFVTPHKLQSSHVWNDCL